VRESFDFFLPRRHTKEHEETNRNQKANLKQSQLTAKGKRAALTFDLQIKKIIFRPFDF